MNYYSFMAGWCLVLAAGFSYAAYQNCGRPGSFIIVQFFSLVCIAAFVALCHASQWDKPKKR